MPLYELEEGTSRKFYRIERVGTRVELHWGRIGTEGQRQTIEADTEAEAEAELNRQIDKRRARGYRRVVDESKPHDPEEARKERLKKTAAPLTDSPRFFFVHKKKKRFVWLEARAEGLLTASGALGTEASALPSLEACPSLSAAGRKRDGAVAKLLDEGYVLTTFGAAERKPRPKTKVAVSDKLEELVRASPRDDDDEQWIVLEDWVLEQDDLRAEWLRAQRDGTRSDEAEARGRAYPYLLGSRWETLLKHLPNVEWRAGFVRSAALTLDHGVKAGLVRELGKAPSMALLRSLEISLPLGLLSMVSELAGSKLASSVKELTANVADDGAAVTPLAVTFPRLERLRVNAYRARDPSAILQAFVNASPKGVNAEIL